LANYGWDGTVCITCGNGSNNTNLGPTANASGCNCQPGYSWNGSTCALNITCPTNSDPLYPGPITPISNCRCLANYGWDGTVCITCGNGSNNTNLGPTANASGCNCQPGYSWNGSTCALNITCPTNSDPLYPGPITPISNCRCLANYGWDGTICITCGNGSNNTNLGPTANASGCNCQPGYSWNGSTCALVSSCPPNSDPSYSGPATSIPNCNCQINTFWCGDKCVDYLNEIIFTNANFEADRSVIDVSYIIPTGWSGSSGNIIIVKPPNDVWGISNTSDGTYVCGLISMGAYISQNFKTVIGDNYTISFYVNKNSKDELQSHNISYLIDNQIIDTYYNLQTNTWININFNFTATNIFHNLKFLNSSPSGYNLTIFIDFIGIINNTNSTIVNGNFESNYPSKIGTNLIGWITTMPEVAVVQYIIPSNEVNYNISAINGNYACKLYRGSSIYQDIPMVIGAEYLVLFYVLAQLYLKNTIVDMDVYMYNTNGKFLFRQAISIPDKWIQFYFIYKATEALHRIQFRNISAQLSRNLYIDNISITRIC
jgi:hypothetical protein